MSHSEVFTPPLSTVRGAYRDPLTRIDWNRLASDGWWLPVECVSLHGLAAFEELPEETRRRLSRYEFAHFLHMGLWLERVFMERTAAALRAVCSPPAYALRLEEIREEAGHSLMFLQLMHASGVSLAGGAFRVPRLLDAVARWLPTDSLAFRLAVLLGEDIPHQFNRRIRAAAGSVEPVVVDMCTVHMQDEARHIAEAKQAVDDAVARLGRVRRRLVAVGMRRLIARFTQALFFPDALLYERAGLKPGAAWRQKAAHNPLRHALVEACLAPSLTWLATRGLVIRGERRPAEAAAP
jgi:hypothetical protein